MEGDLTLDWRSGWQKGGGRGPAIVPGEPDKSLLIKAVSHADPQLQMPEEKLPENEIAILSRWIKSGAADPRTAKPILNIDLLDWWSLKPLQRPLVPQGFGDNPIDAFVRAKLQEQGLESSAQADRRVLLRRLKVDLHGLQPTPDELRRFENDSSDNAWADLVDQTLQSDRYGERWARHWLDTIHFADSHGFEHDVFRPNAWRYRDYVIQSFNRDTPWSQFIREQLAADVFFPDLSETTVALGFLGAGTYDQSAAATAPMSFENLDRDDLVTQVMGSFVSTTASCARCHAHKFDPISQEDYYALQAVFAGIGKGEIAFDVDPQVGISRKRWTDLRTAAINRNVGVLLLDENVAMVAEWERDGAAAWTPLDLKTFVSAGGAKLQKKPDASVLSTGTRPELDTIVATIATALPRITAIRLEVLTDESLPVSGPGRAENGNLHLSEFELQLFTQGTTEHKSLPIRQATADFNQEGWTIAHAIDGNLKTAWGIHPEVSKPHHAVFELEQPLELDASHTLVVVMKQVHGGSHIIGRFRLSATDSPTTTAIALTSEASTVLETPPAGRTNEQRVVLGSEVLRHRAEIELNQLPEQDFVWGAAASAKNERGTVTFPSPRTIRVLSRGDIEKPRDEVEPGALTAMTHLPARFELPEDASEADRRAALANWLAASENPLTWRSIANRVWQYHFGKGLSDTPNDFGRMGSLPTHPELLDWLACELRDNGGSLKHLHHLICNSVTYQQSSALTMELSDRDPQNRWLGRMSRQRLDADSFRDAVLVASGQIDLTMGGPGVKYFTESPGPQATPVLNYDAFDMSSDGANRRSIYRVVWRGIPDPFMDVLDFPDLGRLAPTRGFSASPLQSLVLLNNKFVLHHAQKMADDVANEVGDISSQIRLATMRSWLRNPSAEEARQLEKLAQQHGLPAVCRLLLNSNEFLFVD